jgi:hypothetical protein
MGQAGGRAKNSARPGPWFALSIVRADFEPFCEVGNSRNCHEPGSARIDTCRGKKHPHAVAQNRRDLAERDSLLIGAPSFSPYRPHRRFAPSPPLPPFFLSVDRKID